VTKGSLIRGWFAIWQVRTNGSGIQKFQWNLGASNEFFRDADVTHPDDAGEVRPFSQEQAAFGSRERHSHKCLNGRAENFT
jgi:hypothetical protein